MPADAPPPDGRSESRLAEAGPATRRSRRRRVLGEAGIALIPAVLFLGVRLIAASGPAGDFQAALAGMVAIVSVAAFGAGSTPASLLGRLAAAAGLAGLACGAVAGEWPGAAAVAFLYVGVAAAASGLAAVGRRIGTPSVAAGAVAACVLWIGMTGLFWADPLSDHVERRQRRPFRQAVLHVDPALALAYDGARFDRLRSAEVYFDVPLASSFYDRPTAAKTGSLWLATGLVAWGASLLVGSSRRRPR